MADFWSAIQLLSRIPLHLRILICFLHFQVLKIKVQHTLHLMHRPELSQHMQILSLTLQVVRRWRRTPNPWKDHILIKFRQLACQGFLEVILRLSSRSRTTTITQLYSRGLLDFQKTKSFRKRSKILLRAYRAYSRTTAGTFFNVRNVMLGNRSSEYPVIQYKKSYFSADGPCSTRTELLVAPLLFSEILLTGTDLRCWLACLAFFPVRTTSK